MPSYFTIGSILVALAGIASCTTIAAAIEVRYSRNNSVGNESAPVCGFAGNGDIYGIGIRLGYYTQTLSTWIARYFVLAEAKNLRPVNLIFLLSVFIGTVWFCHTASDVYAIEPYILLTLLLSTWHTGIADRTSFGRNHTAFDPPMDLLITMTMWGVCIYYIWYWFKGLDAMKPTPCGTYVFVFAKLNIYGWIRVIQQIITAQFIIGCIYLQVRDCLAFIRYLRFGRRLNAGFYTQLTGSLERMKVQQSQPRFSGITTPSSAADLRPSFDVALETPLPPSPLLDENPSHFQQNAAGLNDCTSTDNIILSFEKLVKAERYLQTLFNIKVSEAVSARYRRPTLPFIGPVEIAIYDPKALGHFYQNLLRPLIFPQSPLRLADVLLPVLSHLEGRGTRLYQYYFEVACTAIEDPNHSTVDALAVNVILDFHNARVPPSRPVRSFIWPALWALGVWMLLVVSIELAIVWNHISSINNVRAIGQLIPATIGVGGLVRVIWIWGVVTWTGHRGGKRVSDQNDEMIPESEECALLYEVIKSQNEETKDLTLMER